MINNIRFLSGLSESSWAMRTAANRSPTYRILVVESEHEDLEALTREIRRHGHTVEIAERGGTALELYRDSDLVLLDPELPDLDGLEVCRVIRRASDIPIIIVTVPSTQLDPVLGFQAGVDDYVVKPYEFRELMARMQAVMRRSRRREDRPVPASHLVSCGRLTIDTKLREVRVGDRPVGVTRKEFELLHLLASHSDAIVSRGQIMSQVWDGSWSSRTVDTHVSSLRSKLGSKGWILTVRGVGFRLGNVA